MRTQCPNCGSKVFHNKGISKKNSQPYENYKCSNKNCGFLEWIDVAPQKRIPPDSELRVEKDPDSPDWEAIKEREYEKQNHLGARRDAIQIAIANAKIDGSIVTEDQVRIWIEKIKKI